MTIAAGIICRDGIVMCADSQEVAGDFKWPVNKLAYPRSTMGDTAILISGAGFAQAIDVATQEIIKQLRHSCLNLEGMLSAIRFILREIHEKDLPYHPAHAPTDLEFRLLIALRASDGAGLFVTSGSMVKQVDGFEVIGSGEVITKFFAHMMYGRNLSHMPTMFLYEGTVMAAYLVHLAKSQLSSIGGKSHIMTLSWEGEIRFSDAWELPEWETFFEGYQSDSHELMLSCADPTVSESQFSARLKKFAAALRTRKRRLARRRAHWDRLWKEYKDAGVTLIGHTPTPSPSNYSGASKGGS